jgi:ATP-dependent protease ClpP protease subunit
MFDLKKFEAQFGKMKGAEAPASALAKWKPEIHAAATEDEATINIYDGIGESWDGTGMTAKIVSSILRKNAGKDVTVNLNSPGGSFFEGLAIYNMLREYEGDVHVRVVGLAASAASVIAMAGDTIKVAESGFLMIHNSWSLALGNKHDMAEAAETLTKFDEAMIKVYTKRTGISEKKIVAMLDDETWIMGEQAVEQGFATALLDSDEIKTEEVKDSFNASLRKIDVALAKDGMPRSERRALIKELTSTPSAAVEEATPSAGDNLSEVLNQILCKLTQTK